MSNWLLVFEISPVSLLLISFNQTRQGIIPNSYFAISLWTLNSSALVIVHVQVSIWIENTMLVEINVESVSVKSRKELLRSFHRIVWIERKCFAVFEIVWYRTSKAKSGVHNEERKPRAGNDCKGRAVLEAWPEKAENAEALPTYCLQLYLARGTLVWGTFIPRHYLLSITSYATACLLFISIRFRFFGFYFNWDSCDSSLPMNEFQEWGLERIQWN